tara:strand:- start:89 stop:418 length:330 start_codon:yes stop_codon:yes gene_type:complete
LETIQNFINEIKIIKAKDYDYYNYDLNEDELLTGTISSDTTINVYIMDSKNLRYYEDRKEFSGEIEKEYIKNTSIDFVCPKTGKWHLLMENYEEDDANVNLKIKLTPSK